MADRSVDRRSEFQGDPAPALELTPLSWRVLAEWNPAYGQVAGGITIHRAKQLEGPDKFKVMLREMFVLNIQTGQWTYELMPSSRDDEYLAKHRFETLEDAVSAAQKAASACIAQVKLLKRKR